MSKLSPGDDLEIQVANFGPIAEAQVGLRPLTVFVGPSNTGKSYLAILVYALHRHFSRARSFGRQRVSDNLESYSAIRRSLAQFDFDALAGMIQPQAHGDSSSNAVTLAVSGPLADLLRSIVDAQGHALGKELLRCFGTNPDNAGFLVRKDQRNANMLLRRRLPNESTILEHKVTLTRQSIQFSATLPTGMPLELGVEQLDEIAEYVHRMKAGRAHGLMPFLGLAKLLHDLVVRNIVSPLHYPAVYLPADRTGVMHAQRALVSAFIDNAPMAGLQPSLQVPTLSGVLSDFLKQLLAVDHPALRRKGLLFGHSRRIEKAILGGSVDVTESAITGYPHFTYRPNGWNEDLPLMNASSMVSELAPVVLYLRHLVEPDSVLIVEEPESHLHPAMQVEFIRQLAALVRAGVRVIVTTHSEWLLEELANIVRRSALPGSQRKAQNDSRNIALSSSSVGAWLFKPKLSSKGSVVSEISLDETGLYPTGFDDVANALHNDWAEIASRTVHGPGGGIPRGPLFFN